MPQLDGLRALAVLSVLWFHWMPIGRSFAGFGVGELGVLLFFVLSGYLISGILLDASPRGGNGFVLKQFYLRRLLRLLPIYYATLGLVLLVDIPPYRDAWLWHASYLQNFYQQLHGRDMWGSHLWTLAVEEQFYLLWPLILLFSPRRILPPLLLSLVALAPLLRWAAWRFEQGWDPNLFPVGANDCLGAGALLAVAQRTVEPRQVSRIATAASIAGAAIIGVSLFTDNLAVMALRQNGAGMIFALVVWQAARGIRGPIGRALAWRPAVYLGRISYGVYVIHGFAPALWSWFFYSAPVPGYRIFARLGLPDSLQETLPFQLGVYLLITFGLAVCSWHFLESPLNQLKKHLPYRQFGKPK